MFLLINSDSRFIPLKSNSVQCVITSPPYFNLRDYNHVNQIGNESFLDSYIKNLVSVFDEVWRVLKDDGVVWLNIGDTYVSKPSLVSGIKLERKNLFGVPWRVAFALQERGWILRQDIIWHKTKTVPEGVRDRCTQAHEYLFLLAKNSKYFWNYQEALEKASDSSIKRYNYVLNSIKTSKYRGLSDNRFAEFSKTERRLYRNKKSVWSLGSASYRGLHFAVFPTKLVEPCVLITTREGDIVLDPFSGSGTVGVVAKKYKRVFIGLDINFEYNLLAKNRILIS